MAITEVSGFPKTSANLSTGPFQVSVTTSAIGDLIICTGRVQQLATGTMAIASVSGGGATNWQSIVELNDSTNKRFLWAWFGTVSSVGTSNLVVTFSGTATISGVRVAADSFTSPGQSWGVDVSGSNGSGVSSTTLTWPSLTPSANGELWWGYGLTNGTFGSGTPASFTFSNAAANETCFNPSPTGGTAYQPSGTDSASGAVDAVGVVFTPSAGGVVAVPIQINARPAPRIGPAPRGRSTIFIIDNPLWVPVSAVRTLRAAVQPRSKIINPFGFQYGPNPRILIGPPRQTGRRYPWQRRGKAADAVWPNQAAAQAPKFVPQKPGRARLLARRNAPRSGLVLGQNEKPQVAGTHRYAPLRRGSRLQSPIVPQGQVIVPQTQRTRRIVPKLYRHITFPFGFQYGPNPRFVAPNPGQRGRRYAFIRRSFIGLPPMPQTTAPIAPNPPCITFPATATFDSYKDLVTFDTYRGSVAIDAYTGSVKIDAYSGIVTFDAYKATAQIDSQLGKATFDAYSSSAFLAAACP